MSEAEYIPDDGYIQTLLELTDAQVWQLVIHGNLCDEVLRAYLKARSRQRLAETMDC